MHKPLIKLFINQNPCKLTTPVLCHSETASCAVHNLKQIEREQSLVTAMTRTEGRLRIKQGKCVVI